ncbi:MAG: TetR/AcrR family transcriptional regulator [Bacteroidota bacterium]
METNLRNHIISDSHYLLMQEKDNGYTVDSLAKDMKRSKKTIYKVFGSKSELIKEVITTHQAHLLKQFNEIAKSDESEIDKLIKYIYRIDGSLREIRLSRWYQQAKQYVRLKEKYFEIRIEIYEVYLKIGLLPYNDHLNHYQKSLQTIIQFIVSSLEYNYFYRSVDDIKNDTPNQYVDELVFLLHGCLISLDDV